MPTFVYYIIGGVAIALIIVMLTFRVIKRSRIDKKNNVEEIKGVRYTTTSEIEKPEEVEDMDAKISYNRKDILIPIAKEMVVGKNADIKPGKYTILTTVENKTQINIRLGGYVRIYKHGSEIVLAEGDKITPISVGIILR